MLTWFSARPAAARSRIIAEIAQTHDGSLGTAHAYIDAVAAAGADAIKFQTHIAEAESTPDEPWRVKFSPRNETRFEYWKRMEFTREEWQGLADHARARGLVFLSSAFSLEAVELLEALGIEAWKVGAGEVTNLPMIARMAATGKPVMLSSGMSGWAELDAAAETVVKAGAPLAVFQCTSAYPCPAEKLGLNVIGQLRDRYECPVGLSDHSGKVFAGLAASTLGADLIEVHVTFSRECFGPDVPASLTTGELRELVEGVQFIGRALANPVDKEQAAGELAGMKRIFGKSVVAQRALPAGHCVETARDLALKKPGTGMPAECLASLEGRRLRRPIAANGLLSEEDFE